METTAQYQMIDPGAKYHLDVEKADMFIARACSWPTDSREREIERNSMGWNILRAYAGIPAATLESLTGPERFEFLTETRPRLVFGTPRPDWAFTTDYHDLLNEPSGLDSMSCTHIRSLMSTPDASVAIVQFDNLDINGDVLSTGPRVTVHVESDNLSPHALLQLARACRAATEQLSWIGR